MFIFIIIIRGLRFYFQDQSKNNFKCYYLMPYQDVCCVARYGNWVLSEVPGDSAGCTFPSLHMQLKVWWNWGLPCLGGTGWLKGWDAGEGRRQQQTKFYVEMLWPGEGVVRKVGSPSGCPQSSCHWQVLIYLSGMRLELERHWGNVKWWTLLYILQQDTYRWWWLLV